MPTKEEKWGIEEEFENNKKLNKIIKKNLSYIRKRLNDKYNYHTYFIDRDLFYDQDKEKYYDDLFSSIYENYETIISNDDTFFVEVSVEKIYLSLNTDTKDHIQIWIYPYNVDTRTHISSSTFEFQTKKDLFKKYLKKFTEIEFFQEYHNSKKFINVFRLNNKIDRKESIDSLLSEN